MHFLRQILREISVPTSQIVFVAVLTGISNAGILAIINAGAEQVTEDSVNIQFLLLFLIVLAIYILAQRFVFHKTTAAFERFSNNIQNRIVRKVQKTDLETMERIGTSSIYNRITRRVSEITQSANSMTASLQSSSMVVCISLYIAYLSVYAFIICLVLTSLGILMYIQMEKKTEALITRTNAKEEDFYDILSDVIEGFKELKLSKLKREEVLVDEYQVTNELEQLKVDTANQNSDNYIFAQVFFYVLVGAVVFVLPRFVEGYTDTIMELATSILFLIGPLTTFLGGYPAFTKAAIATYDIKQLEDMLDKTMEINSEDEVEPIRVFEKSIEMKNLSYSYRNKKGEILFSMAPIDLSIQKGETLFIVGGNGSGKTTFLKLLIGLYKPDQGQIFLDGHPVTPSMYPGYRELFGTIFNDFHLFRKLYGLMNTDKELIHRLLKKMNLEYKTDFNGQNFTNLNLSTGQRKRLSMIVNLLEDRPINVYDEWAADQDPIFREYFYAELLQELKAEGKTVIAISHDDRYFDRADRVVKFEYGKIIQIR